MGMLNLILILLTMIIGIISLTLASLAYQTETSFDANRITSGIFSQDRLPNTSVNTISDQSIDGFKTFIQPLIGNGSSLVNINAANLIGTLNDNTIPSLFGNTLNGVKTFSEPIVAPNITSYSLSRARYYNNSDFTTVLATTNPSFLTLPLTVLNQTNFTISTLSQVSTITYNPPSNEASPFICKISLLVSIVASNTCTIWVQKNAGLTPLRPSVVSVGEMNASETFVMFYLDQFSLESGDTLNICCQDSVGSTSWLNGHASLIIQ